MIAAAAATISRNSSGTAPSLIRNLQASFYKFQRHNVPFTITNTTTGTGTWAWKMLKLEDPDSVVAPSIYATSSLRNPTWTLPEGHYMLYGETQGLNPNPVAKLFINERIRVLPLKDSWDFELNLDNGNNIFDVGPSGLDWGDNITVRLNQTDATVGRIRINNYVGTGCHLIVDEPMEINAFGGSSGLYFVNCQNLILDAVGDNDDYFITLDGIGVSTSHGIVINTTTDIRCRNLEIYGVDIQVDEVGASGIRVLGDESATYNRVDTLDLQGLKFAHIKGRAGAEFGYWGFTNDTDGGDGGPPQFTGLDVWDIEITTCVRNPLQLCNQKKARVINVRVTEGCTGGEPSHNSAISTNPGCQDVVYINIRGYGCPRGISQEFGFTGSNPLYYNCIFETTGNDDAYSTMHFIKCGNAPDTNVRAINVITMVHIGGPDDPEVVYKLDSTIVAGTQNIDILALVNNVAIKDAGEAFFELDGTNSSANFDTTTGNLLYSNAGFSAAKVGANFLPNDVTSPLIDGGVDPIDFATYAELMGEYDDLQITYDIDGYVLGLDGQYPSGPGAGIELKLAALT